ncbi:hypothetical protein ACVR0S_09440 [Streptococcus dentapri]|uniref:Short chain dehydrogenase n=1 Tax=Streptococcus dentapri TaxID=573564 RepID=A0ABV8D145_9STRE
MPFEKSYTYIIGASFDIGYEAVKAFEKRDNHLILITRRKEAYGKTQTNNVADYPVLYLLVIPTDLSDSQNCYHLYEQLKCWFRALRNSCQSRVKRARADTSP